MSLFDKLFGKKDSIGKKNKLIKKKKALKKMRVKLVK